MAEKTLHSLKTNAARLGARLGENLAEHSRDLGLIDSFASGSGGGSGKYLENGAVVTSAGIDETKKMLASRRESDRMEGLKRVIAMMTKSLPVTSFFPLVTSLLSPSTPLQARTLISLYIVHCAATAPELALLSINAYQKDLSDPNPIVRAGAIKTLSAMGLEDIRSLVGMAVSKGARDGSWYVRRASADAITALWRADPTFDNRNSLLPTLIVLLSTASPLTVGSALSAWEELCPTRWDLLHQGYRKWCKMLMDVEEWGQCVLLRVLVRYGRTFFLDPAATGSLDPDAELLLRASEALLQHLNPAVVSAVVKVYYYLAPADRLSKIVRPLLRLQRAAPEVQAVILEDCAVIAEQRPALLAEHLSDFIVRFSDPLPIKQSRLRILVALACSSNIQTLLKELLSYVKDVEDDFSAAAIAAIGTCAQRVPAVAEECLKTLVKLTQSKNDAIVAQSVLVLRSLLRSSDFPKSISRPAVITKLVVLLEAGRIKAPAARATVYWLVGQFAHEGLVESVGPDLVRLGAKDFAEESDMSKLQLLTLSAKLLVLSHLSPLTPHLRTLALLFTYLTTLARYDLTYEVRDRARFLKGLLAAAGVGVGKGQAKAKLGLGEEEFRRGVQVEDYDNDDGGGGEAGGSSVAMATKEVGETRSLTSEQVRKVLFEGKNMDEGTAQVRASSATATTSAELGTFALFLPSKRLLFSSSSSASLPPYPSTVPPSSIRDRDETSPSPSTTRSSTPMRGFGSDSLAGGGLKPSGGGRANGPVVLVPTNFSTSHDGSRSASPASFGAGATGRKSGFVDLEDFYADEDEDEESSGSEEEEEKSYSDSEEEVGSGSGSEEEEQEDQDSEEEGEEHSHERQGLTTSTS